GTESRCTEIGGFAHKESCCEDTILTPCSAEDEIGISAKIQSFVVATKFCRHRNASHSRPLLLCPKEKSTTNHANHTNKNAWPHLLTPRLTNPNSRFFPLFIRVIRSIRGSLFWSDS